MKNINYFCSKIESVRTNILRFNRNGTLSLENYNKEVPVFRVPKPGCYRVEDIYDLLMVYLLYNVTYLVYTRSKCFVANSTYHNQNLSALLCARLGIMFNEMFSPEVMGERGSRHEVMLSLSDEELGVGGTGILLEVITKKENVKAQVSLTEGMDEAVTELYTLLSGYTTDTFPKSIGSFYDTVLASWHGKVDFGKVIKPNILVERIMNENLPAIYNSSLSETFSTDYISNLSMKSYLIANQNITSAVLMSEGRNPRAYMNRLFQLTKEVFSSRLGGMVTSGTHNRDELYTMLMANMLFSTASKYRRAVVIEALSHYIDDGKFQEYAELLNQNKTTVFYT